MGVQLRTGGYFLRDICLPRWTRGQGAEGNLTQGQEENRFGGHGWPLQLESITPDHPSGSRLTNKPKISDRVGCGPRIGNIAGLRRDTP